MTKETNNVQTMTENSTAMTEISSPNIQNDTITESLQALHQKLEQIELTNETQFKKMVASNKEADKRFKELKDEMQIQHRGTRRRFEALEKKPYSGYFN